MMASVNRANGEPLTPPTTYFGTKLRLCRHYYTIRRSQPGDIRQQTGPAIHLPGATCRGHCNAACLPATTHTTFYIQITGGIDGAIVPAGINTNETVYFVRHAEAHPKSWWEDGNYSEPDSGVRSTYLTHSKARSSQLRSTQSIQPRFFLAAKVQSEIPIPTSEPTRRSCRTPSPTTCLITWRQAL